MYISLSLYIYIYICNTSTKNHTNTKHTNTDTHNAYTIINNHHKVRILAIFYPFSQFFEVDISLLSLQKQPKTAPNLFQRGV